jgi:hypothetical protein
MHLGHITIANFLNQGCTNDVDAKVFRVPHACDIPFNVIHSPYWHEPEHTINNSPKGYMSPRFENPKPWDSTAKEPKSIVLTNDWIEYGASFIYDGCTNAKGKPLINVLGVSASGVVLLSCP